MKRLFVCLIFYRDKKNKATIRAITQMAQVIKNLRLSLLRLGR